MIILKHHHAMYFLSKMKCISFFQNKITTNHKFTTINNRIKIINNFEIITKTLIITKNYKQSWNNYEDTIFLQNKIATNYNFFLFSKFQRQIIEEKL